MKDHFYHGLCPYLHDALSFAMVELTKREQAHPMFDTLYTLAKKLEAGLPVFTCQYTPSSDAYREKHRCYPAPVGRVAALEEEGVVSANPTSGEDSESEVEAVDGFNVCLAQAMSHYQREEWKCFVCGSPGHFARDYPHCNAFKRWHWQQLNAKGAGKNSLPTPRTMNQQPVVNVHVMGQIRDPLLEVGGPTAHWIRPETLVDLTIECRNVNALADSGSQVKTIMPTFMQHYPVLPLEDLVKHLLNLVRLGRKHTSPLRFVILCVQVREITGYDEDVVFLVVPDESKSSHRVPLVIGTCTIGQIINVIRESVKPLFKEMAHVMITPLKMGEGRLQEARPLPLGLHVLHIYTCLKNGSSKVSLMVRNMSDSHIFIKKGVLVVRVMSASPVPPMELLPEMEATLGMEARPEPMSVVVRQEKLLEKLNLDGLAHWSPRNAAGTRELVLAYHDVFTLESNELGCTSAIKHEIHIRNSETFKEQFWHIPPPLLEEMHTSLWDMLEAGVICLSQLLWCNAVVLVRKKDGTLCFCVDFRHLNVQMKKDSYPLPCIQEVLESMMGCSNTWPLRWVTLDSISSPACRSGCVMPWQLFSILCKIHWAS